MLIFELSLYCFAVRPDFFLGMLLLCRVHDIALFEDVVMTGARCGSFFVGDRVNIYPDAIAFGKVFNIAGVLIRKTSKTSMVGRNRKCTPWKLIGERTTHGLNFENHLSNSAAESTIVQIAYFFLKEFDILVKLC